MQRRKPGVDVDAGRVQHPDERPPELAGELGGLGQDLAVVGVDRAASVGLLDDESNDLALVEAIVKRCQTSADDALVPGPHPRRERQGLRRRERPRT